MSVRSYKDTPLTLKEVSQLLWASQGIVASGRRAAPSAGATYPLEIFFIAGKVEGLKPGLYKYRNKEHSLELIKRGRFEEGPMCCGFEPGYDFESTGDSGGYGCF